MKGQSKSKLEGKVWYHAVNEDLGPAWTSDICTFAFVLRSALCLWHMAAARGRAGVRNDQSHIASDFL